MGGLIAQGARLLEQTRRQASAVMVRYRRGDLEVSLEASPGEDSFERVDDQGIVSKIESRDFLISVEQLRLGGQLVEPRRGDRIIETDQLRELEYEVLAPGDAQVWRFHDRTRTTYRVHTKLVRKEGVA